MHSRRFKTSDLQRNMIGQSNEMSPLVSMLFFGHSKPLKYLMEIFKYSVNVK